MHLFVPLLILIIYYAFPDPLVAARLELRQSSTQATQTSVMVGQEFEVEVWIDSENQPLSGAAVFLTFDEEVFALNAQDRVPRLSGFQPFAPGRFLSNGEIFRNDRLADDDPASVAPGVQLDYSVVRALDRGVGPIASFRLRAKAPSKESVIRIDESGIRETRVFLPDGSQSPFRFITPLRVGVQGITLRGLPSRLVLPRGAVDASTLRLDDLVFDPLYGPEQITWTASPTTALEVTRLSNPSVLRIAAPVDASPWERLILRATNPDGQAAVDTLEIFVDAPPVLSGLPAGLTLAEDEPHALSLDPLVIDPDTPPSQLHWQVSSSPALEVELAGVPPQVRIAPQADWHGAGWIELVVADEYGFADTARVAVEVLPVNDPPRFLASPNLRLTEGRQDSSLVVAELARDLEDPEVRLSWKGGQHIEIEQRHGRLIVGSQRGFLGTEEILLMAEDSGGLTATALLTVAVVPSLPPSLVNPPRRQGIAAGDHFILSLDEIVVDPDDRDEDLVWKVSGQQSLKVQLSSRAVRIEAPTSFAGVETLTLAVTDPTGHSASFDLLVFSAPRSGEPLIAALPPISVPLDGFDASLDLDEYLFDLDHPSEAIEWFLPERQDLNLRVDPHTHVLTVEPTRNAQPGPVDLELRALDPDGHEAVQSLHLELTGRPALPSPSLALVSIGAIYFLQSETYAFDLDDYVSGGLDPAQVEWRAEEGEHLAVTIDPLTHRVVLRAVGEWTGSEEIAWVATCGELVPQRLSTLVTVLPAPALSLGLREQSEVSLFAGETELRLDPTELLTVPIDPARLSWKASGSQPLSAEFDPEAGVLILRPASPWQRSELLTLQVRDPENHEAIGHLQVQVYPADGSVGQESPDFELVAIPHPLQPEYVDLYLLAPVALPRSPLLRLQDGSWQELSLSPLIPGIWQARHVLQPGQESQVEFLALGLDADQQVLKAVLPYRR